MPEPDRPAVFMSSRAALRDEPGDGRSTSLSLEVVVSLARGTKAQVEEASLNLA